MIDNILKNALQMLWTGENFTGAVAKINKQNPSVSNTQFSEAFVRVRSGSQNQIDNIQVGWMVIMDFLLVCLGLYKLKPHYLF